MNQESFGKLFESLYSGSMVGAGEHVFSLWPYCIAHARPPHGLVEINPRLIAAVIGTKPENVQSALDFLCAPDPESRSKLEDGRRLIREGQFLYRMVNFAEYRQKRDPDLRREQTRLAVAKHRSKHKLDVSQCKPRKAQAEAEAEAEAEAGTKLQPGRPAAAPKSEKPKDPNHYLFRRKWEDDYMDCFGRSYAFTGGKDAKCISRLLAMPFPYPELMEVANKAWRMPGDFNCKQATSISGFLSRLNEIMEAVKGNNGNGHSRKLTDAEILRESIG